MAHRALPLHTQKQQKTAANGERPQKSQRSQDTGRVQRKRWVTTGIYQVTTGIYQAHFLPSWWKGRQKTSPEGKLGGPGEKRQAGPPQGNHRVLTSLTVSYRFQPNCDKPKQEAPTCQGEWPWSKMTLSLSLSLSLAAVCYYREQEL